MSLAQKYYSLLNLPTTASVNDIKKAYRAKAKQLHPDRNPSPTAEEDFIELNEAYEYLVELKTNGRNATKNKSITDFEKWWHAEEARRKERAKQQAKMRYEEYINSKEYKLTASFDHVINIFFAIIALAILVAGPIIGYIYGGGVGVFISVLVILMTLPLTLPVVTQLDKLKTSITSFKASLITLFTHHWFKDMFEARWPLLLLLIPINFFIVFKIAINTLINTNFLVAIYILAIIIGLIVANLKPFSNRNFSKLFSLGFAPLIINLFFLLNFLISSNPTTESYFYNQTKEHYRRNSDVEPSSYIILENNAYEDYQGLRVFMNYRELISKNNITFTFETGLFGFRVMKDYKLNYIYEEERDNKQF